VAKPKVDWSQLCNEYVTASQPVTLTDLAVKYGVRRETVSRNANKDNWDMKRERYLTRVEEQTTELKATTVATEGARWDDRCLIMAKKIMDLADEEVAGHPAKDRKGNVIVDSDGKPWLFRTPSKDVASAVKAIQEIGKAALGDKADGGSLDLLVLEIKKALT